MLDPGLSVCSIASTGAVELQATKADAGKPLRKMCRPLFPPRLNFTGITLPALATLSVGRLSTGWKNPEMTNGAMPKFQWLACEVRTVNCAVPSPAATRDAMQ